MSVDKSIVNTGTGIDVDIAAFKAVDKSAYVLIDPKVSDDDNSREALYQLKAGSMAHPRTVRIGSYKSPNANDGIGSRSTSVKTSDWIEAMNGAETLWTRPLTIVVAINAPGDEPIPDIPEINLLIQETVSWLVQVALGEVSEDALTDLAYSLVGTALEHENSAST